MAAPERAVARADAAGGPADVLIEARDLRKVYRRRGREPVVALDGVSFVTRAGETLALIGESGSGKSTVGKLLLALTRPDAGEIVLRGRPLGGLGRAELRDYRRSVQMVFQDPLAAFNPQLTIGASLRDAMHLLDLDRAARTQRAAELLEMVHLSPDFLGRYPSEVSGGQLQRVGIARALATGPSLVFLDEPTSALDVSIRGQILELLRELQPRTGATFILVSHDMRVVRAMATHVVVLYLGQVVERGPAERILARPLHPYTRALLRTAARGRRDGRERLRGEARALDPADTGCRLRTRCPFRRDECDAPQDLRTLEPAHSARCWRAEAIEAELAATEQEDA
jgi:oligopeptide/dipeptide ABC transporter ATP-binding protein